MTGRREGLLSMIWAVFVLRWERLRLWWRTRADRWAYSRMFDGRPRRRRD
jgi:hypothetical protein